jgi:hypothetical protein
MESVKNFVELFKNIHEKVDLKKRLDIMPNKQFKGYTSRSKQSKLPYISYRREDAGMVMPGLNMAHVGMDDLENNRLPKGFTSSFFQ